MAKAGVHQFCASIIKSCDHNFTCSVGSSSLNHSEAGLKVKTGVCQGCVMSAVLFNLVIDRVTQHTTETSQKGSDGHSLIHWRTLTSLMTLHCYFTRIGTYKRRHAVSASLVKR